MRYLKFVAAIFLFILTLPEQALANLAPVASDNVMWQLLLIFPLIIIFTEFGGGYPILKSIRDESWGRPKKFLTGIGGPLIALLTIYIAAVTGDRSFTFLVFILFAVYALVRGIRMIRWGFIAGGKSGAAELHMENAKPWRLNLGGWLLAVFTLTLILYPLTLPAPSKQSSWERSSHTDATSNLHNIYLGCKAYWADNGSGNNCTVDIVSQTAYGYIQSSQATVAASGDEAHFSATATHEDISKTFVMDPIGNIFDSSGKIHYSNDPRRLRKGSEKSWAKEAVKNIKANLKDFGFYRRSD